MSNAKLIAEARERGHDLANWLADALAAADAEAAELRDHIVQTADAVAAARAEEREQGAAITVAAVAQRDNLARIDEQRKVRRECAVRVRDFADTILSYKSYKLRQRAHDLADAIEAEANREEVMPTAAGNVSGPSPATQAGSATDERGVGLTPAPTGDWLLEWFGENAPQHPSRGYTYAQIADLANWLGQRIDQMERTFFTPARARELLGPLYPQGTDGQTMAAQVVLDRAYRAVCGLPPDAPSPLRENP